MTISKSEARKLVRKMERDVGEEYLRACDEPIAERFFALPEYAAAGTVMLYAGVGTEVDTAPIIERALKDGKTVALPRISGSGVMCARRIRSVSELVSGAFGIPEPSEDCPLLPPESIELIVVPGLAFTPDGFRLGHGGGYYDRFLTGVRAFTVGLAREKLLFDELPAEAHDIAVDIVITESRGV